MDIQQFKIGDRQKSIGKIIAAVLLGGAGLLVWSKVLPFLTNIVWGTIELGIGVAVGAILLWVFTRPKFWLGLQLLGSAIGRLLFGWIIEMDPWNVLYERVDKMEEDREALNRETQKLMAQEDSLKQQLAQNDEEMRLAQQSLKLLETRPDTDEKAMVLEEMTSQFNTSKEFIDAVKPIYNDIKQLITYSEKAYDKSGHEIRMARQEIKKKKALYEAVTTGSSAMSRAMRAFTGRKDLNEAAEQALDVLRKDIGLKIGKIKTSIKVTSQFMNSRDLKDAAKVKDAVETMKQIDQSPTFSYSTTLNNSRADIKLPVNKGNRYLDNIK